MDAQTRRMAQNWAKLQLRKAARPKRVASAKTLEHLARGRAIRAANIAKKKSGGSLKDVAEYAAQARRHARHGAQTLAEGAHDVLGSLQGHVAGVSNRLERAGKQEFHHATGEDPMFDPTAYKAFVAPPKHLHRGLAVAGAAGALGLGAYALHRRHKRQAREAEFARLLEAEERRMKKKGHGHAYA